MFERILVPLDGSERAEAVLPKIHAILQSKNTEVLLFHALDPWMWTGHSTPSWETMQGLRLKVDEDARSYLSKIEARLKGEGVRARSVVRETFAAEGILQAALEERATMIAIATHGRSGVSRFVFGSVAEKLLRASAVPLLLVRSFKPAGHGTSSPGTEELVIRKILVPIDASNASMEVVPSAIAIARHFGAHVLLLNVCEDHPQCSVAVPQMTHAFERFREAGLTAEPLMKKGNPAVEILEACQEHSADLIAMSTHGRSGVSRWVLGSVAEKVLRTAAVPLIVVRSAKSSPETVTAGLRNEEANA